MFILIDEGMIGILIENRFENIKIHKKNKKDDNTFFQSSLTRATMRPFQDRFPKLSPF